MRAGFAPLCLTILAAICLSFTAHGQTITDSQTPPEVATGIPSTAYALSNLDTVNPYTGSLNVHIPLLQAAARRALRFPWVIEQKWQPLLTLTRKTTFTFSQRRLAGNI